MSGSTTSPVAEKPSPKTVAPAAEKAAPERKRPAPAAVPAGGAFLVEPVVRQIFTRERFSEEQKEIDRMVREFARERILPEKDNLSKPNRELSLKLLRETAELGLTGIDIPERFGGMELDKTTAALAVEALSWGGSASWIVTFSCHVGIGSLPVVLFGSEEQKAKYLPKLASAEYLGAYALTEAESGSDVLNLATTALPTEEGDAFVLNGTKLYITNGGWADLYTVFANLEGAGTTAFLVERSYEGVSTGAEEHKMGIKGSSTVTLNLDNVRVPKENLLGRPGKGLAIALNILNIGRFKLGAGDLGGCKNLIGLAAEYALERHQFGQPIAFFEAIRKKFADMVVRTYLLDSAVYRTVGMMDERISALDSGAEDYSRQMMAALEEYAIESSIVKILGSETMFRVSDHGIQIYGGYGFSEEYPMAETFRDTRIDRIFEGTNEINRMVIYGYFLKKALMEELPLREAERAWTGRPEGAEGPFRWEIEALDAARRLTVKSLFEAISIYGQDLRNAQVLGEDLADLAIGYFSASAALNRILQLDERTRSESAYRALARLSVATFLEDAWRLLYRLRPALCSGPYGSRLAADFDREMELLHLPFDPAQEIHILTDDLFDRRSYRFE